MKFLCPSWFIDHDREYVFQLGILTFCPSYNPISRKSVAAIDRCWCHESCTISGWETYRFLLGGRFSVDMTNHTVILTSSLLGSIADIYKTAMDICPYCIEVCVYQNDASNSSSVARSSAFVGSSTNASPGWLIAWMFLPNTTERRCIGQPWPILSFCEVTHQMCFLFLWLIYLWRTLKTLSIA